MDSARRDKYITEADLKRRRVDHHLVPWNPRYDASTLEQQLNPLRRFRVGPWHFTTRPMTEIREVAVKRSCDELLIAD